MLNIDTNYRSLPEQVDYLTDKQTETDETLNEVTQDIDGIKADNILTKDRVTSLEQKRVIDRALIDANTEDISTLNSEVEAVAGKGGYLIPHNFGTATPTEQQLNDYALSQITNITQPEEIFNGTRVTNLYNNHTWILNNTQDTDPVVFEWVDLGQSLVSIATENTLGVVKGSPSDFNVTVNNDGTMSVNGIANALNGKQDKLTLNEVQSGTIDESIGFDTDGNVVRGSAGGGSLYKYDCNFSGSTGASDPYTSFRFIFVILSPTQLDLSTLQNFKNYLLSGKRTVASMISSVGTSQITSLTKIPYYVSISNNGNNLHIIYYNIDFTNGKVFNGQDTYSTSSSVFSYSSTETKL